MHNTEYVLKNDGHKLQWDFDIQTDNLISARRPDLIIIYQKKKKTCKIVDFAVLDIQRRKKKENEKKDKHLDLAMEGDNYTNRDWSCWYSHQRINKGAGGLGSWKTSGDHPNNNIFENGQNTENSHGYSRRLAVTQTPVKDHQLKLMWKILKG